MSTPCSRVFACPSSYMCPSRTATPACLGPKAMFEGCILPYAPVGLTSRKDYWDLSFAGPTGLPWEEAPRDGARKPPCRNPHMSDLSIRYWVSTAVHQRINAPNDVSRNASAPAAFSNAACQLGRRMHNAYRWLGM